MRFPSVEAVCLIVSLPLIVGCTPEKAEAVLTAIKAFESSSNQALTAYENLFKEYRALKRETQDDLFVQVYAATNKHGVKSVTFDQAVANVGQLDSAKAGGQIENEFRQLRAAYSMLTNAYESLPQGSLTGAQHVSCGQKAVAKLTRQLVNFSSDINKSPLYPAFLRQDFAEFKALAIQGAAQKDAARSKFDTFYFGLTEYEKRHHDAINKTLAAVEQGKRLNQLLVQYDVVTVANILAVIQYRLRLRTR